MKIKVKYFDPRHKLEVIKKGDWVDLKVVNSVYVFHAPFEDEYATVNNHPDLKNIVKYSSCKIKLNVAMELPKGFEAVMVARSGTFDKYGIIMVNGQAVIDCSYNGDDDQWKFPALAFRDSKVSVGDRICQFRIQPSQFATRWQKIKWLFTNKIKFVEVEHLGNKNRGGFGSTGK